jgi:hypothetical protein
VAIVCVLTLFSVGNNVFAQRAERPRTAVPPSVPGVEADGDLVIKLWTDKGDKDPTYYVGERIYISFTVNKDCYFTLYDIDSTGNVNIMFPNPYHTDNLVRKGRIYTIPTSNYQYDLFIKGPTGEEILFALGSSYAYYHWQYGKNPPPIWSDEWGTPSTWGHSGGSDNSLASRRFQQRLQLRSENLAELTVKYIKHHSDEIVKPYPVTYARCRFFVTISPY